MRGLPAPTDADDDADTGATTSASDAEVSDSPDTAPIIIATKPSVTVTDQPDGVRRARIDATDEATWVQFGFAGAAQRARSRPSTRASRP